MIRSNLAHDGKTPNGPDLEKSKRDQTICTYIYSILIELINLIFDNLDRRLIVYSSLKNNEIIGTSVKYFSGKIQGIFTEQKGNKYFEFIYTDQYDSVDIAVNTKGFDFNIIDTYEGPTYQRILIPAYIDGKLQVCYIYQKNVYMY